jgi:hypothetical protein
MIAAAAAQRGQRATAARGLARRASVSCPSASPTRATKDAAGERSTGGRAIVARRSRSRAKRSEQTEQVET